LNKKHFKRICLKFSKVFPVLFEKKRMAMNQM
jgi:hypothetical protein